MVTRMDFCTGFLKFPWAEEVMKGDPLSGVIELCDHSFIRYAWNGEGTRLVSLCRIFPGGRNEDLGVYIEMLESDVRMLESDARMLESDARMLERDVRESKG